MIIYNNKKIEFYRRNNIIKIYDIIFNYKKNFIFKKYLLKLNNFKY